MTAENGPLKRDCKMQAGTLVEELDRLAGKVSSKLEEVRRQIGRIVEIKLQNLQQDEGSEREIANLRLIAQKSTEAITQLAQLCSQQPRSSVRRRQSEHLDNFRTDSPDNSVKTEAAVLQESSDAQPKFE